MRNWGRFFRPSEYSKDMDFKSDDISKGVDVDKKPAGAASEKTPKQRVDEYVKQYGTADHLSGDRSRPVEDDGTDYDHVVEAADKAIDADMKFDSERKLNPGKFDNKSSKEKRDNDRNRRPTGKGNTPIAPRDIDNAARVAEMYDGPIRQEMEDRDDMMGL